MRRNLVPLEKKDFSSQAPRNDMMRFTDSESTVISTNEMRRNLVPLERKDFSSQAPRNDNVKFAE